MWYLILKVALHLQVPVLNGKITKTCHSKKYLAEIQMYLVKSF